MNADPIALFIVHWNRPRQCAATLNALLAGSGAYRPIIIDNASDPEAVETLRAEIDGRAEIIQLNQNRGWGPALNVALRSWLNAGTETFGVICAHDAEPGEGCVELLLQAASQDRRLGIVCPQYADATIPHLSALHGVQLKKGETKPSGAIELVDVPHGTLMLVRRECLKEIGFFDERYFAYGDEHEIGARAVRRGWKVAMVWGATVANPETSTPATWRSYLFARNSLLLVHDYFGRTAAWCRAAVILITAIRSSLHRSAPDTRFAAGPRWRAVRDFLFGRFGVPAFR